jgi:hypothetical protein
MTMYRLVRAGAVAVAVLALAGIALAATTYRDRVGDVEGGPGPDLAAITVSDTETTLTFRVRFAEAPPLRVSRAEGWVDMLLVGIDVPPRGARPVIGGDWRGADYALGTHGPSKTGLLVRLGRGENRQVARFRIVTRGSTLAFSFPKRAIGSPSWFAFQAAAARETGDEAQRGGVDFAPSASATFRYRLTR